MLLRRPRSRPLLLTLLDAGLVLSASAAIVILLGGRTRFDVAGVRVALMAPAKTAIAAVVFAALRFAFGGATRPFPVLPAADLSGLDADRQRFASL